MNNWEMIYIKPKGIRGWGKKWRFIATTLDEAIILLSGENNWYEKRVLEHHKHIKPGQSSKRKG